MNIQDRQNLPESLAKLSAQRLLYRYSKWWYDLRLAGVALIGVSALVAAMTQNQIVGGAIAVGFFAVWLLDEIVFKKRENTNKAEAATIQEDFDCVVLDLPWPVHKGVQRPTSDRINQLARAAKNTPGGSEELEDWYTPNGIPHDPNRAKIYCQRMNCWWDVNLRQKWTVALKIAFWIFAVLIVSLSTATGITLAKFIVLAASGILILSWGISETQAQIDAIKRMERLHRYLSELLDAGPPNSWVIRGIQDEIFDHRRSNHPVPDWFYWRSREHQESEAAETQNKGGVS